MRTDQNCSFGMELRQTLVRRHGLLDAEDLDRELSAGRELRRRLGVVRVGDVRIVVLELRLVCRGERVEASGVVITFGNRDFEGGQKLELLGLRFRWCDNRHL